MAWTEQGGVVYVDCGPDGDERQRAEPELINLCTPSASVEGEDAAVAAAAGVGASDATSQRQGPGPETAVKQEELRSLPQAGQLPAARPTAAAGPSQSMLQGAAQVAPGPAAQPLPAGVHTALWQGSSPSGSCQTGGLAASAQLPAESEVTDGQQGDEEVQQQQQEVLKQGELPEAAGAQQARGEAEPAPSPAAASQEGAAALVLLPASPGRAAPSSEEQRASEEQKETERAAAGGAAGAEDAVARLEVSSSDAAEPMAVDELADCSPVSPPNADAAVPMVATGADELARLLPYSSGGAAAPMAVDQLAGCGPAIPPNASAAVPVVAVSEDDLARLLPGVAVPGMAVPSWPLGAAAGAAAGQGQQLAAGMGAAAAGAPECEAAAAAAGAAPGAEPESPHALLADLRADLAFLDSITLVGSGGRSKGMEGEGCSASAVEAMLAGIVEAVALAVEGGSSSGGDPAGTIGGSSLGAAAWDPSQPSTSAAAAAHGAGAQQQAQQGRGSPAAAGATDTLAQLRSLISPALLEQYGGQHVVNPAETAAVEEHMTIYHKEVERLKNSKEHTIKDDMKAVKNLKKGYCTWSVWRSNETPGHPSGVEVGRKFAGRSELQIGGVHSEHVRGISHRKAGGCAVAICCSGGYQDDNDHGDWLLYTGEGGRDTNSRQVEDQDWESPGNRALRQAFLQGQPVRVARGSKEGKQSYSYDGLYAIVKAERVANENGIMVCRFTMVGIPGHYNAAARRVTFLEMRGFKRVQLASKQSRKEQASAEPEQAAGSKRTARGELKVKQQKGALAPPPKPRAKTPHKRPGFVLADISGGLESVPIPVFNEVDSEPPPSAATGFTYIKESQVESDPRAEELLQRAKAVMPGGGHWCGLEQQRRCAKLGKEKYKGGPYNADSCLMFTVSHGIWECGAACKGRMCGANRVATKGIHLPLEVFRVPNKGWGLRCSGKIYMGDYIGSYEGEVLRSCVGELRKGGDAYLYDMDHFTGQYNDPAIGDRERQQLPPLPPGLDLEENEHLVIDALHYGNVARFLNHSCSPNLLVQTVLTEGSSTLHYRTCFFAARDIAPFEELTYDYNYKPGSVPGVELQCHCGVQNCRGRLL